MLIEGTNCKSYVNLLRHDLIRNIHTSYCFSHSAPVPSDLGKEKSSVPWLGVKDDRTERSFG